jgi:hypothetical protein
MAVSSAADQAVQTLTAQWYNAICTGCNLDPNTFQLVQGAVPLQLDANGTTQIWQIFNSIPPRAINHVFSGAEGNVFSDNYFAVINALEAPPAAQAFQNAVGSKYAAWQTYIAAHMPVPYSPAVYCSLFESWAMINLPAASAQKAIQECSAWQLNAITQAQSMQLALALGVNGANAGVPAFTITIGDIQAELQSAPSRTTSMNSSSQSSDTSQTWSQGAISGGFDLFSSASASGSYDDVTSALAAAGLQVTVSFEKLVTLQAGPLAVAEPDDPTLSQYVPWYNSAALSEALNNPSAWSSNGSWADAFGPAGNLLRVATQVVLVDGITIAITSAAGLSNASQQSVQAGAQGGVWPFFQASGSGGWSTTTGFDGSGNATITSTCAAGNPNILGVSVTAIGSYLGAA